jgi:pimeloyl-ACP methyl ester carboxylesterase
MTEPTRKSIALGQGEVSALEWLTLGQALHFAHANGFNAETYRALLQPLSDRFHVIASDARGHGFTTLPTTPGLAEDWRIFRDDLVLLLDAIGSKPVVLAGHSMGGTASVMAAAMRPDLVRALILIEPVFVPTWPYLLSRAMRAVGMKPPIPDLAERAERRRDVFPSFDAALAAYVGRGAFKSWPEEVVRDYLKGGLLPTGNGDEMRLACRPTWEAEDFRATPLGIMKLGAKITCPVTIVHGGKSGGTCRDADAAAFARAHGYTRIVKVAEASHFLPMEFPDIAREEISRIL